MVGRFEVRDFNFNRRNWQPGYVYRFNVEEILLYLKLMNNLLSKRILSS